MTKVLDLFTLKIRLENLGLILNLGQQKIGINYVAVDGNADRGMYRHCFNDMGVIKHT